jgi:hypothetical protein
MNLKEPTMIDNVLNTALCLCLLIGSTAALGSAWQIDGKQAAATVRQQHVLVASATAKPAAQAALR